MGFLFANKVLLFKEKLQKILNDIEYEKIHFAIPLTLSLILNDQNEKNLFIRRIYIVELSIVYT